MCSWSEIKDRWHMRINVPRVYHSNLITGFFVFLFYWLYKKKYPWTDYKALDDETTVKRQVYIILQIRKAINFQWIATAWMAQQQFVSKVQNHFNHSKGHGCVLDVPTHLACFSGWLPLPCWRLAFCCWCELSPNLRTVSIYHLFRGRWVNF